MPAPGAAPVAEPLIAEPTCGSVPLEIWMVSLAAPVRLAALLGCEASRGDAERRVETIQARGAIDFFKSPESNGSTHGV